MRVAVDLTSQLVGCIECQPLIVPTNQNTYEAPGRHSKTWVEARNIKVPGVHSHMLHTARAPPATPSKSPTELAALTGNVNAMLSLS